MSKARMTEWLAEAKVMSLWLTSPEAVWTMVSFVPGTSILVREDLRASADPCVSALTIRFS